MKSLVLTTLFELGVHIGHTKNMTLSTNNEYILGSRHSVDIIDIKKSIWSLRNTLSFLYHIGKEHGLLLFHCTSLDQYNYYVKLLFINLIVSDGQQSFFDERWSFGQLSNFRIHAVQLLNQLFFTGESNKTIDSDRRRSSRYKKKRITYKNRSLNTIMSVDYNDLRFFDLLLRVLFYTYFKRIEGIEWENHFSRMNKYWRFFIFFKFFKSFLTMPDVLVLVNPDNVKAPIIESVSLKIPVISLVDTNTSMYGITYPVFANDDSIIVAFFYFKLFLNSYKLGKTAYYKDTFC
jgi:ribosomal protein S2